MNTIKEKMNKENRIIQTDFKIISNNVYNSMQFETYFSKRKKAYIASVEIFETKGDFEIRKLILGEEQATLKSFTIPTEKRYSYKNMQKIHETIETVLKDEIDEMIKTFGIISINKTRR